MGQEVMLGISAGSLIYPPNGKQTHLSKVEVAVLEIMPKQRGALVDGDVVPDVDQVEV